MLTVKTIKPGYAAMLDRLKSNSNQRPLAAIPKPVIFILAACFAMQIFWARHIPKDEAFARNLAPPRSINSLKLLSLGEPIATAQFMTLYLQAFDNQPGISIPFVSLNYERVSDWLSHILILDPRGQYPLLMASQLYAQVPDASKQRQMLAFVHSEFFKDPDLRWPWLAHGAIIAKHRLHDLPLALQYAQAIAQHATGKAVPHWAQQMPIFILQDMGELESAKIMLGALLANGTVTDAHEIHFLMEKYQELQQLSAEQSSSAAKK